MEVKSKTSKNNIVKKTRISLQKIIEFAHSVGCNYNGMVCLKSRKKVERVLFLKFTITEKPFWVFYDSKSECEIDEVYEALVGVNLENHPYVDYIKGLSTSDFSIISIHDGFVLHSDSSKVECWSENIDPIYTYGKISTNFSYDQLVATDFEEEEVKGKKTKKDPVQVSIDRTTHGKVVGCLKFSAFIKESSLSLQMRVENMVNVIKKNQIDLVKKILEENVKKTEEVMEVFRKMVSAEGMDAELIYNKMVNWRNLVTDLYSL